MHEIVTDLMCVISAGMSGSRRSLLSAGTYDLSSLLWSLMCVKTLYILEHYYHYECCMWCACPYSFTVLSPSFLKTHTLAHTKINVVTINVNFPFVWCGLCCGIAFWQFSWCLNILFPRNAHEQAFTNNEGENIYNHSSH